MTARGELRARLRFAAPQLLTAVRIGLAVLAVESAFRGDVGLAATLLLLGLVTDVLDGACARMLGVAEEFGKLFDFFADYLYFVVAPFAVSLALAGGGGSFCTFLLGLPCVCAALRYSRKAGVSETEFSGIPASPGVPTIAYALFVVALALLRREGTISGETVRTALIAGAPLLGGLMVVRTRYPKLSVYPWILVPILVGLAIMPFVLTSALSAATLGLIVVYVVIGPPLVQRTGIRDRCY